MESYDQWLKRMALTYYKRTLCDVKKCTAIASHTASINHVPHGIVKFHVCSDHYDRYFRAMWEEFHPNVKAYNEYKG